VVNVSTVPSPQSILIFGLVPEYILTLNVSDGFAVCIPTSQVGGGVVVGVFVIVGVIVGVTVIVGVGVGVTGVTVIVGVGVGVGVGVSGIKSYFEYT
jgi:hypothetical protein